MEGDFIVYVGLLRFPLILNTNCLILTHIYVITGTDHVPMMYRSQKKKTSFCHKKHRHVVSPELDPKYSMTLDMLLNQLEKQFK